jgi:hypothetical protein
MACCDHYSNKSFYLCLTLQLKITFCVVANVQKVVKCSLEDFSEGFLGKMRVRKSGKTELVLGNVIFDVSMGVPASFLQVSCFSRNNFCLQPLLGHRSPTRDLKGSFPRHNTNFLWEKVGCLSRIL